jgi:tetratricopeptide (TPR) repeat protein
LQRWHSYSYVGTDITSQDNASTAPPALSKRCVGAGLLAAAALTVLVSCATGADTEVKRLRAQAAYELGISELREGRTSAALASLREAVDLSPREPLYWNMLGLVHLNSKNLSQAMEAFKKALELNSSYSDAQYHIGLTLAEGGRWKEAIEAYQKALALQTYPFPETIYTNIGWAYYNLGQLREAETALVQAVRLEPTLEAAHYHLGLVLLKGGRREEAKAAFRRTRDLAPDGDFGKAAREHLRALGEGQ